MKRIITSLIFLLCFSSYAQTVITLKQAQDMSQSKNKSLFNDIIDISIAKRKKIGSYNAFYPKIDLRTDLGRNTYVGNQGGSLVPLYNFLSNQYSVSTDPSIAQKGAMYNDMAYKMSKKPEEKDHWFWDFNLGLSWTFQAAIMGGIKISNIQYEIAQLTYQKNIREARSSVTKDFYNILLNQEKIKLTQENIKNLEKKYELLQKQASAGLISNVDLLKTQINIEKMRPQLQAQEQGVQTLKELFKMSIGLESDQDIELVGDLDFNISPVEDPDELVDSYIENREDYKQLESQKRLYLAQKQTAQLKAFTPYFSMSYNFTPTIGAVFRKESWQNAKLPNIDRGALMFSIGMSLTDLLPYSEAWNTTYESKQNIKKVQNNMDNLKTGTKTKIRKIVNDMNSTIKLIDLYNKSIEINQKLYESLDRAFRAGSVRQSDVDDVLLDLFDAKTNIMDQKIKYMSSMIDLQTELNTLVN